MSKFDENSRVKIPALIHLTRLGYKYISLKDTNSSIDKSTNIFIDIFHKAINQINNKDLSREKILEIINDIKISLATDDLGEAFYKMLLSGYKNLKLIDFENKNNIYNCVTELTYSNNQDQFRPDITLLINGLPLSFIEVKKPNNKDGIQAEYIRMDKRIKNRNFRSFINITQIMVFSNNSEYKDNEGAFYATASYTNLLFNRFKETNESIYHNILAINNEEEYFVLKDTNHVSIISSEEYKTNKEPLKPTNRILTSLFHQDRILMLLKYAMAYVRKTNENGVTILEKHIMRYPQFFATKSIEKNLNEGVRKGIIWHTQGSGKTALAYYNVRYLTDFYQKQGIIAKFYFIVDRLDLKAQTADEFRARGLQVEEIDSKESFITNIKSTGQTNNTGKQTITVVNIHNFSEESITEESDYNIKVQRIYFLDEAHRSYNIAGSFLKNLIESDRNAIILALTGTPLIGEGFKSTDVFGDYMHKYFYNDSISDGYTLRLIHEGIETTYRHKLLSIVEEIKVIKGSISDKDLYAHPKYVSSLVNYITEDFNKSRIALEENTIGAMIVSNSKEQAQEIFNEMQKTTYSCALILHDSDTRDIRKKNQNDFKKGSIDFLIVYQMLLTGFDAPRLKKLYLGRVIKDHSLLQALTRVNRPYKNLAYGYVVDFADIQEEFDKTNKAYFEELHKELGNSFNKYSSIFKTTEEIENDLNLIQEKLFLYDTDNAEIFSQQISEIDNKSELLELRHAFDLYKELFNIAALFGYTKLTNKFDVEKINILYREVNNCISRLNRKQILKNADDMTEIINLAIEDIDFEFTKISESELIMADNYRDTYEKTRREFQHSLDPKDPEYISLMDELQRLLKKTNIIDQTSNELKETILILENIRQRVARKNQIDQMLAHKYNDDSKYMRTHKRIKADLFPDISEMMLHHILSIIKQNIDNTLISNEALLNNEVFFRKNLLIEIKQTLEKNNVQYDFNQLSRIGDYIAKEYITERNYVS